MKILNQSTLGSKITLPDTSQEDVTTLSNESSTEYMTNSFLKVKAANKTFVKPGDEVEYTITLTNNSEYSIENVSLKDILSIGQTFKAQSVVISDVPQTSYDPTQGFAVTNEIVAGGSVVIKYITTTDAQPAVSVITNKATITYSVNEVADLQEDTNTLSIPIVNNNISVVKSSDKSVVIKGQTLTYQIVISNEGNTKNTNLLLTDPLNASVSFVAGSVKIDGVESASSDPTTGITLSDLEVGGSTTVTFDVTVN